MKYLFMIPILLLMFACSKDETIQEEQTEYINSYVTIRNNIEGETINIIKHVDKDGKISAVEVCMIGYQETSPVIGLDCGVSSTIFPFRLSSKKYTSVHDFETAECVTLNFTGDNSKNNPIKVELNKYDSGKIYLKSINQNEHSSN